VKIERLTATIGAEIGGVGLASPVSAGPLVVDIRPG
jgi:hypothetical protein